MIKGFSNGLKRIDFIIQLLKTLLLIFIAPIYNLPSAAVFLVPPLTLHAKTKERYK